MEAENGELREELQAVSDDLEALVRENQAVGAHAIAAAAERDGWREQAADAAQRAAAAEAASRAADAGAERLRKAYEVRCRLGCRGLAPCHPASLLNDTCLL